MKKLFCLVTCLLLAWGQSCLALNVQAYYGKYDIFKKAPGKPAESFNEPKTESWQTPEKVLVPYRIGVLLPHLYDRYWLGVNYGIIEQARKLGVHVKVYSAGGYDKGGVQRRQLTNEMLKDKVHGIILASVAYDKFDRFIAQITNLGIPIVSLINDVQAPNITGKVLISYYDIGWKIGQEIIKDTKGKDFRVAFFPGPKEAKWAQDTFNGFVDVIRENPSAFPLGQVTIVAKQFGEASPKHQGKLLDYVLNQKKDIDYVIGVPALAKVAPDIVKKHSKNNPNIKVVSTYLDPELYSLIEKKEVYMAATDMMIEQAKIALDMLVRILNGEKAGDETGTLPFRVSPNVVLLNAENVASLPYERLFGDDSFRAKYKFVVGED